MTCKEVIFNDVSFMLNKLMAIEVSKFTKYSHLVCNSVTIYRVYATCNMINNLICNLKMNGE